MPRTAHESTRVRIACLVAAGALLAAACTSSDDAAAPSDDTDRTDGAALTVEVVSSHPDAVTGGDAVVEVSGAEALDPASVTISVDGTDVTPEWTATDGLLRGAVDGLPEGEATIEASDGEVTAELAVINHPTTGPVFSGPHMPLPVCTTELLGLGPATDDDCSAPTEVRWVYVDTTGEVRPLDDPATLPDDVATVDGTDTPFVIREEQGVLNRSIYWIRALDPSPGDTDAWDAAAWNGRLVYEFGGGCGTTWTQGFNLGVGTNVDLLAEGYATATATFNTFQVMCNDVLSAETASIVKEHFSESYGVPELTIGSGGSGGAIQQHLIAQNYPGILDGLVALLPFPDALSIAPGVVDCALLNRYYDSAEGAGLSPEQRASINGHAVAGTCDFWEATFAPGVDPTEGCTLAILNAARGSGIDLPEGEGLPGLDPSMVYDPDTNPEGLRCTLQDTNVNQAGVDPDTGFARRPLDSVGVVYGLDALSDGAIDLEQLITLNESVGSFDIDGVWVPERAEATLDSLDAAYAGGRIIDGSGDLSRIPVITIDVWTDDQGDIHDRARAFALRERLRRDDGTLPPNHVIWTRDLPEDDSLVEALVGAVNPGAEAVGVMDEWLTALAADDSGDDHDAVVERTRPDEAIDNCITPDGERVSGVDLYDEPGPCTDPYPLSDEPRTAAGAPLINDVLKCQLRPLDEAVSSGELPDLDVDQRARLDVVFPDGVCDWSKPGVGQVPTAQVWRRW